MGRVYLADESGLNSVEIVSAVKVENLERNDGVDCYFTAEVSKIDCLLGHTLC